MAESIVVTNLTKQYTLGRAASETMLRDRLLRMFRNRRGSGRRETIWALDNVSFEAGDGQVVGIIGRNGAGKSTLLRILSKITYPTSGTINTRGRLASLLEVGTGFHDELTGRENIYLNGSILGLKKKEVDTRLDAIVAFSGVDRFIDTPIKHYSSGMRLRLGFAVAAHLDPDILLIDEVLAVGDAGFRKKCLTAMEDLRSGGRTVLFVSHDLAAVEGLCSRVIWIDEGHVRLDGSPKDVIPAYMNIFSGQDSSSDLRVIDRRQGTGEIRYTGIQFLSADRVPQAVTRTGDRLIVRLSYHASKAVPRPSFGFRLYTDMGTLITSTSTWLLGVEIPLVQRGDGDVDLDIACLSLVPGRYNISLWISDGPHGSLIYDALEHCTRLDVEASNFHGSGRKIDSGNGIVYFPQAWHV